MFARIAPRLGIRHPYHLCAHFCLLKVAMWRRDNDPKTGDIPSYFEQGARGAGDLEAGIGDLKRVNADVVPGSLHFARKTDLLPLQAGDIIAYEAFKQTLRNTGHETCPRRRSLVSLESAGIGFLTEILTLEMMTDLIDQHEALRSKAKE